MGGAGLTAGGLGGLSGLGGRSRVVGEMRRKLPRDIVLREGRGRAQDQLGVHDSLGDIRCHQRQLRGVSAASVLKRNAGARGAMRRYLSDVAPPQPDVVALQRKIACGCEGTIAAAKHRDLQDASPCAGARS